MKILLVVYDNDSYIHWFPVNIAYIASSLKKNGHDVIIYNQDIHHFPECHLTSYLNKEKFDVIGVGVIGGYYQYKKLLKISKAINRSRNRPFYILGGHGPSPEPAYFLSKTGADAIVIGEGELTIVKLLGCLENNNPLDEVKGIAFTKDGTVKVNDRQELIKEIDSIPFPAYDAFPIEYYRLKKFANTSNSDFLMPMISGRGCKFNCNFCYRMDKGFRPRSTESIMEEVKLLKKDYGITYIYFFDELLMSSKKRTILLCEAFMREGLGVKWACMGRLNYASPDVLRMMKKAGCQFIVYGIEAMDNVVLKNMNKGLTTELITRGIENTLSEGISPGLSIIFGNIGDNLTTLEKGVQFLLKHDDGTQLRTIRPVTPYPGCELYDQAIKSGKLKDVEDFYENKHINSDLLSVNFTELTDDEFHTALFNANKKLIENYYEKKKDAEINISNLFYRKRDPSFRGFRDV